MTPTTSARSEQGIALVIVLLLMAVISALATGLTVTSQMEVAMAQNEMYYVGARAAAEAGLNRARAAIVADTTTNLLAGQDGAVDDATPAATVNADNGNIDFLLTGGPTYALDANGQYTYTIQILDDDDPSLYATALSAPQLVAMGAENGNGYINTNDRLVLQATGSGPNGTTVRLRRLISSIDTLVAPPPVAPPAGVNAAIVVDGNLTISGNPNVNGSNGSVHANGDMSISGNPTITQNAFASGTYSTSGSPNVGGSSGGGQPTVTVPEVNASDYLFLATHILTTGGQVQTLDNPSTVANEAATCNAPCLNWSFSGGNWSISGNSATSGTFYAQGTGSVRISGNPGSAKTPIELSIIAEGSIEISGNPYLKPQNSSLYQFVTNGDLKLGGNVDIDPTTVEGQSLVRDQLMISGNPDIRGRIIVKNHTTVSPIENIVSSSVISGNPEVTYNGTFAGLAPPPSPAPPATTSYANNVLGWIES